MAKRLGYADAVKLLGGDSAWAEILGRLVTASVSAVPGVGPLLSFLNLTDSVQQAGQAAITQIRTRARGLARFERSQLIEAAHAVLVVSAFFDALDILDADLRAGLNSATLDLTAREQAVLATGRLFTDPPWHFVGTLIQPGGIPGVHDAWATEGGYLLAFYQLLALHLPSFAAGTAVWDERDETTRDRWMRALSTDLPLRACLRYEGTMAQLAGEFPEFAFWASRAGVSAILDQLTAVRHSIAQVLAASVATASQQPAAQVRRDLATLYRARVSEPVAEAPATPGDVTLPRLRDLYVAPACRKLPADRWEKSGGWLTEAGWTAADQPADLWTTVLQHLLSTEATQVPMVLFGQPGAGKSMFTQMLAAELDARDYLVVRVELRSVPADASIARQITAALESLTLRSIDWPDLAETAGSAQPVIILDGFDELLQASGRDHQNYLEQVQEFQRHEARLGRPTAVLVTSRTAVANQVRHPEGTVALRLEEFGDDQITQWLAVWNRANPHRPLPPKAALAQAELARQPLLVFMLALFHTGGGSLTEGMRRADLYQRLFREFALRDVRKIDNARSGSEQDASAERDLDLLSLVAFAMFNRSRESVAEDELIIDLPVLYGQHTGVDLAAGRALVARLAGRFFFRLFMQQDQATRGVQATTSRFEFLHATFGEFLIARWTVERLRELAVRGDDALFHALLSRAVLSTREQRILGFLTELLADLEPAELTRLRDDLTTRFGASLRLRPADPYVACRPPTQSAPAVYAAYSANLFVLLLLTTEALSPERAVVTVTAHSLGGMFPAAPRLWHSQLSQHEWNSLVDVISSQDTGSREPLLSRWSEGDLRGSVSVQALLPDEIFGIGTKDTPVRLDSAAGYAMREAALLHLDLYQEAFAALLPYLQTVGQLAFTSVLPFDSDLLTLMVSPPWELPADQRADVYQALIPGTSSVHTARLLLEQLRIDIARLDPAGLAAVARAAQPLAWAHIDAYLDVLAVLHTHGRRTHHILRAIIDDGAEYGPFNGQEDLSDLMRCEASASDVLGLARLLPMLGLFDLIKRDPPRLPFPPGPAGLRFALQLALWAAATERGLPVDQLGPGPAIDEGAKAWLEDLAPGWLRERIDPLLGG